ncbi:hypothetical protein JS756_14485 [Streptomyces actuosus]|uniref:Uncharacterized protein n=1 Tax=Streptomyces actuosus TaxID=1885 RepID=A0ABS2VQA3_STRAS|nr:hypothetical protein [Streptomyces actuosus]MBN0045294.1 hypothetical protein [Streptomyces actuosus]
MGRSKVSIWVEDTSYAEASFRISPAASWRTFSLLAASAARSALALDPTAAASGSLWWARAAARLAEALGSSRGMDAFAVAMASEAWDIHFAESSLKSASRRTELARSPAQVRKASAPSPFHSTHCGRIFSSAAILRISFAAPVSLSAAPWTVPLLA